MLDISGLLAGSQETNLQPADHRRNPARLRNPTQFLPELAALERVSGKSADPPTLGR